MTDNYFSVTDEVAVMMPDMSRGEETEDACVQGNRCDFSCVDSFPLSMAYVPMQKYEKIFDLDKGYSTGTIFQALNLPFEGYMRKGGGVS